jgi:hypothetical protein
MLITTKHGLALQEREALANDVVEKKFNLYVHHHSVSLRVDSAQGKTIDGALV